jgi:hypothetical protein
VVGTSRQTVDGGAAFAIKNVEAVGQLTRQIVVIRGGEASYRRPNLEDEDCWDKLKFTSWIASWEE